MELLSRMIDYRLHYSLEISRPFDTLCIVYTYKSDASSYHRKLVILQKNLLQICNLHIVL